MKRIAAFEWLWNFHVQELREFLEKTESGVNSEFNEFTKWVDQNTKGMSEDEAAEFIDHYYDDLAMVRNTVPTLLRYSQCLVIYGAFEHEAVRVCRLLHGDGKAAKKPKKDMYLHHVKNYLISEAGFSESKFGPDWKFIDSAREIRNAIAHNRGTLRTGAQANAVKSFAKKRSDVELDGGGTLTLEPAFCEELLNRAAEAMRILIAEANKRYESEPG